MIDHHQALHCSTYLQVLKCEPHAFSLDHIDQLVLDLGRVVGCPAIGRGAHPYRRLVYVRQLRLVGVFAEVDVAAVVALLADHLKSIQIGKAVKQLVGSALLLKFHAQCMGDQWSDLPILPGKKNTFYQGRKIRFTRVEKYILQTLLLSSKSCQTDMPLLPTLLLPQAKSSL